MHYLFNLYTLTWVGLLSLIMAMMSLYLVFRIKKNQKLTLAMMKKTIHEVNAISTGSIGVGKKMLDMEHRFKKLAEKQHAHGKYEESRDKRDNQETYQQASKLLEKGLSSEDVAKTCHIPQAEAELLESISRVIIDKNGKPS